MSKRIYLTIGFLAVLSFFVLGAASIDEEKTIIVTKSKGFTLGVVLSEPEDEELKKYNLEGAAKVIEVVEDSEAERIGIKKDDLIIEFDGKKISDIDDLRDAVHDVESEKDVVVKVFRDGKEKQFTAQMKESDIDFDFHFDDENFSWFEGNKPGNMKIRIAEPGGQFHFWGSDKGGFLGVQATDISEDLLEYFEVSHGVLVEKVVKESPAEKAGLKAGDVIVKIADREIKDYDDLLRTLNFYNPGEKVKINYSRKGSSKTVEVELAEKKHNIIKKLKRIPGIPGHDELIWKGDKELEILEKMEKKLPKIKGKVKDINLLMI